MTRIRYAAAAVLSLALGGCFSSAQWVAAGGEPATADDIRTCRSLSGTQAANDSRARGSIGMFTPGAFDDKLIGDTRYSEEERARQRGYAECMRKLGYRASR